ncbi:DUF1189 family protein [Clostridium sp.]|uniref:DUF1189 family protein n=1 Tax=Clostridium sp. TaxID=1506 RepID=UPI002608D67A|nr:DUF1189 family protein [Clostridium sp.]
MGFISKFINKVKISIFKINKYDELIKEQLSSAIGYALLLSIILGFLGGIYGSYEIKQTKNEIVGFLENDENKFTLENGILNFEKSPIKYEKGKFILYIDTIKNKDEIDSLRNILIHKDYYMAILKDGIIIDVNGYTQQLSFIKDGNIFKNDDLLVSINRYGFLGNLIFVINIIQIFIGMIIDTMLLYIVAQVVNRLENKKISYKDILKICIHSITFATILNQITYLNSLGFIISGLYLTISIKSINKII